MRRARNLSYELRRKHGESLKARVRASGSILRRSKEAGEFLTEQVTRRACVSRELVTEKEWGTGH
ncbi:MAG TPA: hypothetical protein VGT24_09420 [Candidatus Acidoferrales bacterium]|nr:hypothetical protein [Candidatus Acidoferrales bacterium]